MLFRLCALVVVTACALSVLASAKADPLIDTSFEWNPWVDKWNIKNPAFNPGVSPEYIAGAADAYDGVDYVRVRPVAGDHNYLLSPVIALGGQNTFFRVSAATRGAEGLINFRYPTAGGANWQASTAVFPGDPQTNRFYLSTGAGATDVDAVRVEAVTAAEAAEWSDAVYASLPGRVKVVRYGDPEAQLPATFAALRGGEAVKVVMLGDSIINDTSWSNWTALVERAFPGSDLVPHRSVRGGTGMSFYREPGNVQTWVLNHRPDLVVLGGISHGSHLDQVGPVYDAVEHYRDVIRQIRAGSDAEILITTGAASSTGDARGRSNWHLELDPDAPYDPNYGFRSALLKMAVEEGVALLDTRGTWEEFMRQTPPDTPYSYYMRDTVHMNARGQEVAARTLEAFFARDFVNPIPEPGAAALLGLGPLLARRRRERSFT